MKQIYLDEIEIPIVNDYHDIIKFLEEIEHGSISECTDVSAIPAVSRPDGTDESISASTTANGGTDK